MTVKPNFFIVGAPKCGTTALQHYFQTHPDIFIAPHKENHYFAKDLSGPNYIRQLDNYQKLFVGANNETTIGEASVWYLYSQVAAKEIHCFNPDAKIIVMLRNPVDMIYAYYGQRLFDGKEDCLDFKKALSLEAMRKKNKCLPRRPENPHGLLYKDIAMYDTQIQRYYSLFPAKNIHVIIFDDLRENAKKVADNACNFLDVRTLPGQPFSVVNPYKSIRYPWLRDILFFPPPLARHILTIVPVNLRSRLTKRLKRLNKRYNRKEDVRPPMNAELRLQLQEFYKPTVFNLGQIIQRDLGHWCS